MSNVLDLWGLQHGPLIHNTTGILLNGIGGNELLGFLAFDLLRFTIPRRTGYLTRWLLRKLNPGWSAADRVIIRHALAPDDPPLSERIDTWWRHCPAATPMARIYHFYLEEKSRKANALGVATDDLFVEPVAPFLDNDVVDLALQIPPHQRLLARFYRGFIQAQYPRLAALPYSRTGLPANASASRILLAKLMRRGEVRGRLSESPWDRWLREDLREYVHETLLGDASRLQEILPSEFVHEHVNTFMAGGRVPAMAIGQLLSLASFLKQFRPSLA
jgi:asparagine synthetase B (glutamine-hydrolysing)